MANHREVLLGRNEDDGVVDTVLNFSKGVWHGAVESPINGAVQVVNHATSSQIPELDLVDSKRLSPAGQAGAAVGTAVDVIALAYATKNMGGAGRTSALLRAGAVGAAYSGIFTPSDPESKTFVRDRLGNAAIGGITAVAAMGTSIGLDKTGLFGVPAARTLTGSIVYGAGTGAGTGLGYAEANAVFNQGRMLPTLKDLIEIEGQFIMWGAVGGAAGYVFARATAPAPKVFELEANDKLKVWYDRQGNPYRVQARLDESPGSVFNRSEKSDAILTTNGTWGNRMSLGERTIPSTITVDADKTLHLAGRGPKVTIRPDGYYEVRSHHQGSYSSKIPDTTGIATKEGQIRFDAKGNLTAMQQFQDASFEGWKHKILSQGTHINYNEHGQISSLRSAALDRMSSLELTRNPSGTYSLLTMDVRSPYKHFKWNGSVSTVETPGSVMKQLEFTPAGGKPFKFGIGSDAPALSESLLQTAKPQ